MVYRITLSSNPRILLIALLVVGLPTAGVLSFLVVPIVLAVILTVVGGYFGYHLGKFLFTTVRSRITTSDEGLLCRVSKKDCPSFTWDEITHAGACHQGKGHMVAYVYNEAEDKLITIPDEYEGFADLLEELKSRVEVEEVRLDDADTVNDHLRRKLGVSENDESDGEEEAAEGEETEPEVQEPAEE